MITCQKNSSSSSNVRLYPPASLGTPRKKTKNNNTSGTCDHLPPVFHNRATLDQLETCLWCMTSQELLNPKAIRRAFRSKSQTLLFGSCNWGDFFSKLEDDPQYFLVGCRLFGIFELNEQSYPLRKEVDKSIKLQVTVFEALVDKFCF